MKKLIVPVFLCLFFLSGCGKVRPEPPKFDFTATCEADGFSGEIISYSNKPIEVKTVTPEALSGMTAKAGNSIVLVSFSNIEKSSEDFPSIRNFSCSKAALILDVLRSAELNLSAIDEEQVAYTAETSLGELSLVTDMMGNILAIRQENSGFTVRLCHQDSRNTEP